MEEEAIFSAEVTALLQLATSSNCLCQQDENGLWQIYPQAAGITWYLQQTLEDRWLLVVKGQPQINLLASEASTLLYRHKSRSI